MEDGRVSTDESAEEVAKVEIICSRNKDVLCGSFCSGLSEDMDNCGVRRIWRDCCPFQFFAL